MRKVYIHVMNVHGGWMFCPSMSGARPNLRAFATANQGHAYDTRKDCEEAGVAWWLADPHVVAVGIMPEYEIVEHKT